MQSIWKAEITILKRLRKITSTIIWIMAGGYLMLIGILQLPFAQAFIGKQVGNALESKLGTKTEIGRINLGLLNRIIIDDVLLYDQSQKKMLQASRLSVKLNIIELISSGKIQVSSAQLFGTRAFLYKENPKATPNFQFVIDSLSSKKDEPSNLDIRIQSLIIRNGSVKYDILNAPKTPGKFNPSHIDISNISAHMMLHTLTNDSLSASVRKLSFREASGIDVHTLAFDFNAGKNNAVVNDLAIKLPNTNIKVKNIEAGYQLKDNKLETNSLTYKVQIDKSDITPCDLIALQPKLKNFNNTFSIYSDIEGTANKLNINELHLATSDRSIALDGNGMISKTATALNWKTFINDMTVNASTVKQLHDILRKNKIQLPEELTRLGNIKFSGEASGIGGALSARGNIKTDAGNAKMDITLSNNHLKGNIETHELNVGKITHNNDFGIVTAKLQADGTMYGNASLPFSKLSVNAAVSRFDYNGYQYRNIKVEGDYHNSLFNGKVAIHDANADMEINGLVALEKKQPKVKLSTTISHLVPKAIGFGNMMGNKSFQLQAEADFEGSSIEHSSGFLNVSNFTMKDAKTQFSFNNLTLNTGYHDGEHFVDVDSDFGNILIRGKYNYETLPQSFINLVAHKLPTLPGLPKNIVQSDNDFAIIANIHDASFLKHIVDVPVYIYQPLHLKGMLNDKEHDVEMDISIPSFRYDTHRFENTHIYLTTSNNILHATSQSDKVYDDGRRLSVELNADAADNKLTTSVLFNTHNSLQMRGTMNAETEFFKTETGKDAAHVRIHPSEFFIDDNRWEVQPSDIIYSKNNLNIDHCQISNNNQHVIISGSATTNPDDSVTVDMKDIDVAYILNIVDFHSVEFSGLATGRATVKNLLATPTAQAALSVSDFRFENGRMGTLHANVSYDNSQIDINAVCNDQPYGSTYIKGYVSPEKNYIDLGIKAEGTRLEFIQNFCGSFMQNVEAHGNGHCRVFGDLRAINLEGQVVANGQLGISTLNTTYTLNNDTITMVPNEIILQRDTIYDREHHMGIVEGALHHNNLKNLTFDINVEAQKLLAYDFHDYGNQVFYGTVYGTGNCKIQGRKGEIIFDIDATPEEDSFIEYNAAGPEGISSGEFIDWTNATFSPHTSYNDSQNDTPTLLRYWNTLSTTPYNSTQYSLFSDSMALRNNKIPFLKEEHGNDIKPDATNIYLNFNVNTTPDFTLRVLMDEQTGDKISLVGNGAIRATFFNKGTLNMYGNYLIDHGTYTMTIQNVIKKEFMFQQGSSIIFGGDPFNAALHLKGLYTLPAVSLSDLQMGSSFTHNNIRVNCTMDIEGTAGAPTVTFGLDMPTLNADAQQMILSVMNSEEDMNQQVFYLLAVGRFMPQGTNNANQESTTQQSQTSLAMQSILSGTISQQINAVLSNVVKSNNWNFGANISTGDEGFNNAEYEGLLSGRLLDNRLLINGEFGYRDNVNTENKSSFIGDFDVQYLLHPNGNLAVKVYNQTNDRYFTRNTLTTQGVGLIVKKDFTNIRDLFRSNRKKGKKKDTHPSKEGDSVKSTEQH